MECSQKSVWFAFETSMPEIKSVVLAKQYFECRDQTLIVAFFSNFRILTVHPETRMQNKDSNYECSSTKVERSLKNLMGEIKAALPENECENREKSKPGDFFGNSARPGT